MKRLNIIVLELKITVLGQWLWEGKKKGIALGSWNNILQFKWAIYRFLSSDSSHKWSNYKQQLHFQRNWRNHDKTYVKQPEVRSMLRSSGMNVTSKEKIYLLKLEEIER